MTKLMHTGRGEVLRAIVAFAMVYENLILTLDTFWHPFTHRYPFQLLSICGRNEDTIDTGLRANSILSESVSYTYEFGFTFQNHRELPVRYLLVRSRYT